MLKIMLNQEVMRRLALALGLFLSLMMYTHSLERVYLVKRPDFEKMRQADHERQLKQRAYIQKTITQRPHTISKQLLKELQKQNAGQQPVPLLPLDQYIAKQTQGKTSPISGPQWREVIGKITEHEKGQTPPEWQDNTQTNYPRGKNLYFAAGAEPFASLAPKGLQERFLTYTGNGEAQYLHLRTLYASQATKIREALLHPWRDYFWLPFVLGLALYLVVIPKVKRPAQALGYARLWGVMVSDFFSLVFAGVFFLFGFLALMEHHASLGSLFSLDTGPMILVFVMWLLGLLCLGGMWLGVNRRNFWISLLPQGPLRRTIGGERLFAYADMKQASFHIRKTSRLVRLILILGALSPGASLMNMSIANRSDPGVLLEMKQGSSWRVSLAALDKAEVLVRALKDNRVPLDSGLEGILQETEAPDQA